MELQHQGATAGQAASRSYSIKELRQVNGIKELRQVNGIKELRVVKQHQGATAARGYGKLKISQIWKYLFQDFICHEKLQ